MNLGAHQIFYAYFPNRFVLQGVTLAVGRGEVVFLLGANRSGKTTLLECLCGVRLPTRGKVLLGEQELSAFSSRERAQWVAYVPQFAETVFAYTVEEMVLFGRALAQEAPFLLLDEPDAHLDPAHQHRVLSVIRGLVGAGLGGWPPATIPTPPSSMETGRFCYGREGPWPKGIPRPR